MIVPPQKHERRLPLLSAVGGAGSQGEASASPAPTFPVQCAACLSQPPLAGSPSPGEYAEGQLSVLEQDKAQDWAKS